MSGWITEIQAQRAVHQARLREITGERPHRLTKEEIVTLTTTFGDLLKVLRTADPADKVQIYRNLGLSLTYDPAPKNSNRPGGTGRSCTKMCPRGDLNPHAP
ncbi:hypothetical protein [Actinomadura sp. NEAU-AAG7]|uniref:hypothetical protein n=1 Tax=Actinomadura sp. NEAU-AAG7 TaxID=2839640 RepID=UPI001BE3D8F0|nr:hypothetical protein [Actinomadura sp. NEAU-AAG7]MBT2207537.1 hypothetical protein [Actinomadura sp. NEAU-AAG7]